MKKKKIILDLCGGTGSWSKPYNNKGYEVYNITLPLHDVTDKRTQKWCVSLKPYGILAAPPCTQFSWARTHAKKPRDMEGGMKIVQACLDIIHYCQYQTEKDTQKLPPLKFWCLENPYGNLVWFLGKPHFIFHPYEFGDGYSKKTCLWGYFNIPKKLPRFERKYKKKFDKLLMKELKEIRSISDNVFRNPKTRQELRAITPGKFAQAFYEVNK